MSTVVNLGKMMGTTVDTMLVAVKNVSADMDNGSMVIVTGDDGTDLNVKLCSAPTDVTKQEVLLVASPELVEINGYRIDISDLRQFTNRKDKVARAFRLHIGDSITIDDTGIEGTTVVDQYVIPKNGQVKPVIATDLNGNSTLAFKVKQKVTISVGNTRIPATKLEVVKSLA